MKKIIIIISFLCIATVAFAIQRVSLMPLTIQVRSSTTTINGTAAKVPATSLPGRENIALYNVTNATETVWCGHSGVTSSNGWPLTSSAPGISLDLDGSVDIWCVSDGTSTDLRSLETK